MLLQKLRHLLFFIIDHDALFVAQPPQLVLQCTYARPECLLSGSLIDLRDNFADALANLIFTLFTGELHEQSFSQGLLRNEAVE